MKKHVLPVLLLILSGCTLSHNSQEVTMIPETSTRNVIWGEDTRETSGFSVVESTLGSATAQLILKDHLFKDLNGTYSTFPKPYQSSRPFCPDERFLEENVLGFCSGVLIGSNTILTAGHCLPDAERCNETLFTFGRTQEKATAMKFDADEIYSCKRIIKTFSNALRDYALIELDRNVTQIWPVSLGQANTLKAGESVLSLSYPMGLPLKKDRGEIISNSIEGAYLRAKVDTYAGSSGSPLFNSRHELVGILVSGAEDFDEEEVLRVEEKGGCINSRRCTDLECFGERYLKIESIEF